MPKNKTTQKDELERILRATPHYSARRLGVLMGGLSREHVATLCRRHGFKLMTRHEVEDMLDEVISEAGKHGKT